MLRSNGSFTRDYIYVEDACQSYIQLAEIMHREQNILGHAFNFSYESPLSAIEVVNKVLSTMGRTDLKPTILGIATNEIAHQYLSSKKAREVLEWQPNYDFDSGLERTISWYAEQLSRGAQ